MKLVQKYPNLLHLIAWLIIVCVGAYILYLRYPYSYDTPNFYAEDGTIFTLNLYQKGFFGAILTLFNGYLVILQYVVLYSAYVINELFGHGILTLPRSIAVTSYVTFAAAASLPWLLFRRRLGTLWSLILVLFLLLTPMGGSDYTLFGTIGNLKFLFFYVATLLILYRSDKRLVPDGARRIYGIDLFLLLCVMTNILTIFILPVGLYRNRKEIRAVYKTKNIKNLFADRQLLSLLLLIFLSGLYLIAVYINGIPEMRGYLDTGLRTHGFMNAFYRSTWYGFTFPFTTTLNYVAVFGLLLLLPIWAILAKRRFVGGVILFAIVTSTLGFVLNRPGVTEFLMGYTLDGGPGQFFYGSTMLFVFGIFYLLSPYFKSTTKIQKVFILYGIVLYLIWAIPHAGFRSKSHEIYASRPTIYQVLSVACRTKNRDTVVIPVYPVDGWSMDLKKEVACQIK